MEYRLRDTGALVEGFAALRLALPHVSIPRDPDEATLDALGVDVVHYVDPPAVDDTQEAVRDGAEFVGGQWQAKWTVRTLSPAEQEARAEAKRASLPTLTPRQLRLGLVLNGIPLSLVDDAIASIGDEQERVTAQIEWEYAVAFERLHPFVVALAASLGLSPAEVDAMWSAAAEL